VAATEGQVQFAIDTAQVILFGSMPRTGSPALDERIAQRLRQKGKTVLVVVNKIDFHDGRRDNPDFYRLGLGNRIFTRRSTGWARWSCATRFWPSWDRAPEESAEAKTAREALCVCFVGRPNVGKSSLSNQLIQSDRRDRQPGARHHARRHRGAVRIHGARRPAFYPFRLIDTGRHKAATKLGSSVEYFSRLRSLDAIKRTDVVFLVLDAMEGVTQQDKALRARWSRRRSRCDRRQQVGQGA